MSGFQKLIELAPVAVCVLAGPEFVVRAANRKQLGLWQKQAPEVLGRKLFDILPEVASQNFRHLLTGVYQSGESYSASAMPAQFLRNGTFETAWFDFTYEPLISDGGDVEGILVLSEEVTGDERPGSSRPETSEAVLESSFMPGESLLRRNRQLDLLARTAQKMILQIGEETALLRMIFDDVCETLGLEIYFNFLPDEAAGLLRLKTSGGLTPEESTHFATIRFGEHLCGLVAERKQMLVLEDVRNTPYDGSAAVGSAGIQAYAGFPLLSGDRLIGTVSFATRRRTHFADGEIQTIQTVCDQLAATIERQRVNRELTENKLRFGVIFNHQFQLSALLAPDGTIIDISDSAVRLSGTSKESLLGTVFLEGPWFRNVPEAQALWREQFAEAINNRSASRRETPFYASDGSLRYALNTATAVRNAADEVQYLLAEGIEITERKQIEKALQESEVRFRSMFQGSPVSIWIEDYSETRKQVLGLRAAGVTDFDAYFEAHPEALRQLITSVVIKDVNTTALDLYGGTKEELLQGLSHFFVADTMPAFVRQIKLIAAGGGRYEAESVIQTKSGERKNVLVRIDFPASDHFTDLTVALLDITERKQLEQKLREQYDELESIYRNAPIGLGMINRDFRYERINERLAEMNGLPASAHIGRAIEEIVPDLAEQARAIFQKIFDTGEPVLDVEVRGETRAQPGVERIWNESWHPVKNAANQTVAIALVVEEITERKRADEVLRQS